MIIECTQKLVGMEQEIANASEAVRKAEIVQKMAFLKKNQLAPVIDNDPAHRLDCMVCGRDVACNAYVGHLVECLQRNEEFANSTVTQSQGMCNVLSRKTNRYCSMPR